MADDITIPLAALGGGGGPISLVGGLARVHDRLDETASKGDVKELRGDIKTLIAKTGA